MKKYTHPAPIWKIKQNGYWGQLSIEAWKI